MGRGFFAFVTHSTSLRDKAEDNIRTIVCARDVIRFSNLKLKCQGFIIRHK